MATIATTLSFDANFDWPAAAESARAWASSHGIEMRDAVVLVPFVQLLAPARRGWARQGGWMPRIETTRTLAASLAPPPSPIAGQISFDMPTDRLIAARLLRAQSWAAGWQGRDAGMFEQAVASMVEVAQAVARAAAAVAPEERDAYWAQGREVLVPGEGPGLTEVLLARVAFEWAASAAALATDRLFALRPSAWIAVRVGGADRLVDRLMGHTGVPGLLIDADLPAASPFGLLAASAAVDLIVCDDVEDEAQRCAARVLRHLQQDAVPVALIAQDRSLVRRVRALLERQQVPLHDETGWRLSTTRAAARVMALLRSLAAQASADDLLDWLKAGVADGPALHDRAFAAQALEHRLRRAGWARLQSVDASRFAGPAATLWAEVQALRLRFAADRPRSLFDWCQALRSTLSGSGDGADLQADAAGVQVLAALHVGPGGASGHGAGGGANNTVGAGRAGHADGVGGAGGADDIAWLDVAREQRMNFTEFSAWLDATLEQSTFIPTAPADALVVITPLARAMLRPFAAAVLPGADDKRLGAGGPAVPLLGEAQAAALGIDGPRERRDAELLAFAQLLRLPQLTVLRRLRDGSEPMAASPLLERLWLAMRLAGRALPRSSDDRGLLEITAQPTSRPLPSAPELLPARLSASGVEALRACPYRFFALQMLALREHDELDETLEKRDYGNWLHAVLFRFHSDRPQPRDAARDTLALREAAETQQAAMSIDDAEFLPFAAAFERLMPHYVEWLQRRDADGARWRGGEIEFSAAPPEWGGTALMGRIDRIDDLRGRGVELIDYKTGDVEALKRTLKQPTEDTQLAFYAALASRQEPRLGLGLTASYLGLDSSGGVVCVEHPQVEATAQALIDGLGAELERLRRGAPMPALGEGRVCEHCAARGLCRRDDWGAAGEAVA